MNLDTSSSAAHALLVLPLKNASSTLASSLLSAVKRQRYQNSPIHWHVIIVLPSLLSYAYGDVEQYHADWKQAMVHYHAVSRTLSLSSEISFIHGSPKRLIRKHKRNYPEWSFVMNRTQAEKNWIMVRWLWRRIKRKVIFNPFKFFTSDKLAPTTLIWK